MQLTWSEFKKQVEEQLAELGLDNDTKIEWIDINGFEGPVVVAATDSDRAVIIHAEGD